MHWLRDFRVNVVVRMVVLLLVMAVLVITFKPPYILTGILLIILTVMVYNLIRYVNQTNRDLAYFLASVKYDDFTTNVTSSKQGAAFEYLHDSFRIINRKFQDIRAEKEANHQFLQAIVKHVNIGLLGVDDQGKVILMNEALQKMLRKSYLIDLSGLQKIDQELWKVCSRLQTGERELIKIQVQNQLLQLSVHMAALTLQKKPFRIFSFQDIQNELENQEFLAWQKLIRILTHEIMNSVAPISSLSATLYGLLENKDSLNATQLQQIQKSMGVIEKRSEGLLRFTETYRSLTRIPPPNFTLLRAQSLIDDVEALFEAELESHEIHWETSITKGPISFQGDGHLLQQVLINVVKNALDAVKGSSKPSIKVQAFYLPNRQTCIQVMDNGKGISEDQLEQIFVPFYTTKEEGSGIGLSLSRQIMHLHKGQIELQSEVGEGTVVSLKL